MRGKSLILSGVLLACGLFLAACGKSATPQIVEKIVEQTVVVEKERTVIVEKQIVVTATPAPTATREPATVVWWTDPLYANPRTHPDLDATPGAYEKMIAAEYMRLNPHVKVEVTVHDWADLSSKAPAAIAAGAPPDILKDSLGRTAGYARQGLLVDMNQLLPKDVLADILPGIAGLYTVDGKLHGFPAYFWEKHLIYNRAALEAAGLADMVPPAERPDWTFDDFFNLGKAIQGQAGVEVLFATQTASELSDYALHAFLWGAGSRTWKADCAGLDLDNPQALAGMAFLNTLYQEGFINQNAVTAGLSDVDDLLYSGKALMMGGGLYEMGPAYQAAQKEGRIRVAYDPQMVMYPHAAGEKIAGLPVGPTGYVVFQKPGRSAAQLQEIAGFLQFVNGEKWLRDGCINSGQLPALQSAGVPLAGDPHYEQALKWVQEFGVSSMGLECPAYAALRPALPAFFRDMFLQKLTPQQALDGMMAKSKEILPR